MSIWMLSSRKTGRVTFRQLDY